MENKKTCPECNGNFEAQRLDKKFCSTRCKNSNNYRVKKLELVEEEKIEKEHVLYLKTKDEIQMRDENLINMMLDIPQANIIKEISELKKEQSLGIKNLASRKAKLDSDMLEIDKRKSASFQNSKFYEFWKEATSEMILNCHVLDQKHILIKERQPSKHRSYKRITLKMLNASINKDVIIMVDKKRDKFFEAYEINKKNLAILTLKSLKILGEIIDVRSLIEKREKELKKTALRLDELIQLKNNFFTKENMLMTFEEIKAQNRVEIMPVGIVESLKPNISKQEMSVNDIMMAQYDTFKLEGELGEFLGSLDRNSCSISLTGDSGAGKSYFSFSLAELFDRNDFSVYYFSLEEGVGELTKEKLEGKQFSDKFIISGSGKLAEVRKAAKEYDVVIIDSFGKIEAKPADFDKLRIDFPKTIFICIHQKTTAGTVRGGSSILYDSSAMIDVQLVDGERMAKMDKSRYGTVKWVYSIDDKKITSR